MKWCTKRIALTAMLVMSMAAVRAETQTAAESELHALATAFESAWNAHDMNVAFRKLLTEDIDWVNVDAGRGKGLEQVVQGHVRVHAGKFKDSTLTIKQVDIDVLRPDVAVMHVSWNMRGDRNNDGTPREPRDGLFTWVAVKEGGAWKIRASHNTNRSVPK